MDNKRESAREFTASDIQLFDQEGNQIYKGKINDISGGGVLIVTSEMEGFDSFTEGEELHFVLSIPTGNVSGVAEVAWIDTESSRMGLKFTRILNKEGVANLMAFVADNFLKLGNG